MRCSWLIVLCCSAVAAFGQELRVSAEHRNPDQITIEIALEAPPGKAPVALQWESSFAAQQLAMEGKGPVAAKEATEAGKILTCSGGWKKPSETYAYRCILVGGQKPIANGPIATISFKPAVKGPHGTASVTVENVQGVTADLKKMALKDTATTIAIGKAK